MSTTNVPLWIKDIINADEISEDEIKEQERKVVKKIKEEGTDAIKYKLMWGKEFIVNAMNQMDSMAVYPIESYDPLIAYMWIADQMIDAIDKDTYRVAALALINKQMLFKCEDTLRQICENYADYINNR